MERMKRYNAPSNAPRAPEQGDYAEAPGEERQADRPSAPRGQEHRDNAARLLERYRTALEALEKRGIVAVRLLERGDVKYRLVLKKTQRGVIHTLEIVETDADASPVRIDLIGNFQRVLDSAERVLSEMSMDDFREVKEMLLSLRAQQRRRRDVEEI